MTYDFNRSYYDNFRNNRFSGITNHAKLLRDFRKYYKEPVEVVDSKNVSGKINVKSYVHDNFNGDTPTCIPGRIKNAVIKGYKFAARKTNEAWNKVASYWPW